MNDYEYEFMCDSRDKKITARSARHTRTHCGKSGRVRFPHDNLTKKELQAMNGECISYKSLNSPMSYSEFKELPNDLKREYIKYIRTRFGAPDKYIAEMLGTSQYTFGIWAKDLGLGCGKNSGNNRRWDIEKFYAWRSGADENAEVPPVLENNSNDAETPTDSSILSDTENQGFAAEKIRAVPAEGHLDFNCLADEALNMLELILCNAKVKMTVNWHVVEDEEEED